MANITEKNVMLGGKIGFDNLNQLKNAVTKAKLEIIGDNFQESSRIYIMTYAGDEAVQQKRRKAVADWFINPEQSAETGDVSGMLSGSVASQTKNISDFKIDSKFIVSKHIRLCLSSESDFNDEELVLVKDYNMVAAQETLQIDNTLENVVEIRLRRPPPGGWPVESD
jgi:hypothetical protein